MSVGVAIDGGCGSVVVVVVVEVVVVVVMRYTRDNSVRQVKKTIRGPGKR